MYYNTTHSHVVVVCVGEEGGGGEMFYETNLISYVAADISIYT